MNNPVPNNTDTANFARGDCHHAVGAGLAHGPRRVNPIGKDDQDTLPDSFFRGREADRFIQIQRTVRGKSR